LTDDKTAAFLTEARTPTAQMSQEDVRRLFAEALRRDHRRQRQRPARL